MQITFSQTDIAILQACNVLLGEVHLERQLPLMTTMLHQYVPEADYFALLESNGSYWKLLWHSGRRLVDDGRVELAMPPQVDDDAALYGIADFPVQLCSREQKTIVEASLTSGHPHVVPRSVSCIPLINKGRTIAVLYAESYQLVETLSAEAITFLNGIAPKLALLLDNALEFAAMRETINDRQHAANRYREQIQGVQQNFKLLADIGKDITSELDIARIIDTVYANVNLLMDATVFDIGIYNPDTHSIEFPGTIEKGEHLPFNSDSLADTDRLSVHCFTNRHDIIINDLANDYNNYFPDAERPQPQIGEQPVSVLYLPLYTKEKVIGVITVQSFMPNAYTNYHVDILKNLAVYVAIALENATAYKSIASYSEETAQQKAEIEVKNKELALQKTAIEQAYYNIKLLGEIGQDITSSLSVETIIDTVHKNLNDLMDATIFWIGIHKPERNALSFAGGKEKGETLPYFELSLDDEDRLAVYCFKNKSEVWVNDYPNEYHKYLNRYRPPILGDNPHSIVYLPLIVKAEIIGVITVQSFIPHAYTQNHINILKTLAVYAAIGLENALLYENLEKKVAERTAEVVSQKEALEQSHSDLARAYENVKLLGEIGLDIAAELSTHKIIEKVYENVNALMDASIFAIGLLSESRARIEFRGAIEKGMKLETFFHSMADERRFSVWAVENKKEVLINDFSQEYNKYITDTAPPVIGEDPESIIYLPLVSKGIVIGVLTVQSFSRHAYNEYHLNILRNLAIFLANAIENAEAYRKIESQNEEIRKTNDKMTASINYARRIQNAMLPDRTLLQKALPASFVLFRPRDIVSGDFYWLLQKDHKTYVAVVDCTGHGVPGAFMSMIGNEFLNETVSLQHVESPELILECLHLRIRHALKQSESDNRDGMDVALCVIDHQNKVLEYAGARSPLIYISGQSGNYQLNQIKGDRMPIGGMQREQQRTFTKHTIPLDQPLMFYMLSDGFQDQFGGPEGKKYSLSRLKDVFLQHHAEVPEQQRKVLHNELINWIRNERQIDDILVLGFRLVPD